MRLTYTHSNLSIAAGDPGLDLHLPLRPAHPFPGWAWGIAWLGVPALLMWQYYLCACTLALAVMLEMALARRRLRDAPVALCGQGMRWWLVTPAGELAGPYWLDEHTRYGAAWLTLCLKDANKRRRVLWLGRWRMDAEVWRQLLWRVLEQANRLRRPRKH